MTTTVHEGAPARTAPVVEALPAARELEAMIRARPLVAIGLAAGAGALAGLARAGADRGRGALVGALLHRAGALLATTALAIARTRVDAWLARALVPRTAS